MDSNYISMLDTSRKSVKQTNLLTIQWLPWTSNKYPIITRLSRPFHLLHLGKVYQGFRDLRYFDGRHAACGHQHLKCWRGVSFASSFSFGCRGVGGREVFWGCCGFFCWVSVWGCLRKHFCGISFVFLFLSFFEKNSVQESKYGEIPPINSNI